MKTTELRERTLGDLAQLEEDLVKDLWKARFSNFTNQLDDTAKLRRLRREIARVKTIRTEKQKSDATKQESKS
jgi:large subunit ribosomal protein L29